MKLSLYQIVILTIAIFFVQTTPTTQAWLDVLKWGATILGGVLIVMSLLLMISDRMLPAPKQPS